MDTQQDQKAGISISEAAIKLGVSEKTVRRRVKAGELPAYQKVTSQGFEWRVQLDQPPGIQLNDHGEADGRQRAAQPPPQPDQPSARHNDLAMLEALRLVEKLNGQVLELSGRVGFLQHENLTLKEQVLMLQSGPVEEPEDSVTKPFVRQEEAPVEPKSWWKRWLGGE